MGCGATKENIESEMMTLKLYRIELKDKRKMMINRLEKMTGKRVKRTKVPDYIDHEAMKGCKRERCLKKNQLSTPPRHPSHGNKILNVDRVNIDKNCTIKAKCSIEDVSEIETVLQTVN